MGLSRDDNDEGLLAIAGRDGCIGTQDFDGDLAGANVGRGWAAQNFRRVGRDAQIGCRRFANDFDGVLRYAQH